jgi:alpha-N-arabinofuranosidase
MRFARLIGARAYVNGNMGSEPPALMAKWVRYMTAAGSSKLANERRANGRKMPWQVAYFGLGNETWGCGGNMSAKYAANRTKRYATFIPRPPGSHIKLVASGPNADDFHFTKVMMKKAGGMVDALSLHYYTFTHDYRHKGPALGFDEAQWASTLKHAEHMGELIEKHVAIMDRYDPKKRVALVVDEWGGWFDPVHKHRTYSRQVTLRDALIAALTFDIFQRHADRVRMANIAQMINVGQALILTDGPKMVRTPTYWAYDLYQPFKGAKALPARVDTPDYEQGHVSLPAVDASAALGSDGRVHLALVNVDPDRPARVKVSLGGVTPRGAAGKVLTGARMDAHNTFAHPGAVQPADFSGKVADGELVFRLPAESVAVVTFRK